MRNELKRLGSIAFLALCCAAMAFRIQSIGDAPVKADDDTINFEVIGCGPSDSDLPALLFNDNRKMVPLPGWGNHLWRVTTASDSAQFYFNQGLNLFYGFHIQEAENSFQQALLLDSTCVMAYWGLAMTDGPTINSPYYGNDSRRLVADLKMAEHAASGTLEKELLRAQLTRFESARENMKKANQLYADAMKELYDNYPDHTEIPVLYAAALMQLNARNWYEVDGEPKQGTQEINDLLEGILSRQPLHPAALHYYIHMIEPSKHPERALDAADRLISLMPSVAHMVHMPSHIYIRTGHYQKGISSNKKAIAGYRQFQSHLNNWQGNKGLYFTHNADMQGANASLMGNYNEARSAYVQNMKLPAGTDNEIQIEAGYLPFHGVQLYLLDVRFGKWNQVLKIKQPENNNVYQHILWQFGQGIAKAKTGDLSGAAEALNAVNDRLSDKSLQQRYSNRNPNSSGANIASKLLAATIEQAKMNWPVATQYFKEAVTLEDQLRYSEPEDWHIPARHLLAQALLEKGDYAEAQQTLEEDLVDHPANLWAVSGLEQALLKQHRSEEAKALSEKYKVVFELADIRLAGAAF